MKNKMGRLIIWTVSCNDLTAADVDAAFRDFLEGEEGTALGQNTYILQTVGLGLLAWSRGQPTGEHNIVTQVTETGGSNMHSITVDFTVYDI